MKKYLMIMRSEPRSQQQQQTPPSPAPISRQI